MRAVLLTIALSIPVLSLAQTPLSAATTTAAAPARHFDFLLGEWRLKVTPRVSGMAALMHGAPELVGTWRASITFGGQGIEDELRVSDASGNPSTWQRTLRLFNAADQSWLSVSLDAQRARTATGTTVWRDGEMWQDVRTVDREGRPYRVRTRFYGIGSDGFRTRQDRSYDEGKTWDEGVVETVATRSGSSPNT